MINWKACIGILAFGILVGSLAADAQERPWGWGDGIHPVWWPLIALAAGLVLLVLAVWGLMYLAPLVLALIGAVVGVRWLLRVSERRPSNRALEILRERYARGEINKDEFEAKRRDLNER